MLTMRKILVALGMGLVVMCGTLSAREVRLPAKEPYVSLNLPWTWKVTRTENGVKVRSSDKHVNLSIEALDMATTDVQARMAKQVEQLVATGIVLDGDSMKQEKAMLPGGEMVEVSWDATLRDLGPMKVSVSILHLPSNKALCFLYWATAAGEQRNKATLANMLMSIKVIPTK